MPSNLVVNGVSYAYPIVGDQQWGTAATNWAIAVTNGMLQKAGGAFTLTAEVDFGSTYGTKQAYIKSETVNVAAAGFGRLAKTDTINFRNNANGADLALGINGSDQLIFNSVVLSSNPMTTLGDLIYGGASGVATRLAGDTSNTRKFLREVSSAGVAAAPAWDTLVAADITSGTFAEARGGTNQSAYTLGDLLYASATNTLSKLAGNTTSTKNFLVQTGTGTVSAAPSWGTIAAGDVPTLNQNTTGTASNITGSSNGTLTALSALTSASSLATVGTVTVGTWNSVIQDPQTAAKTSGYTPGATDTIIRGDSSGGTFAFTLPTAVGVTGKAYKFVKVDTSLTTITFLTTSAQTIAGLAASNFTLATPGEYWEFVSDGANWQVRSHWYFQGAVAYTPTLTGFGTATAINFISWREGAFLNIQGTFTTGTTTAVQARINLGYNGTDGNVTSVSSYIATGQVVGKGNINTSATTFFGGLTCIANQSLTYVQVGIESSTTDGCTAANGSSIGATGKLVEVFAKVRITGWTA